MAASQPTLSLQPPQAIDFRRRVQPDDDDSPSVSSVASAHPEEPVTSPGELHSPEEAPGPSLRSRFHPWNFLSGSMAGATAKTIIYPLDRVKMIYQVRGGREDTVGQFRLRAIFRDLGGIVRKEGLFALWKGNLASFARTFPHAGIVFYTYDIYHDALQKACPSDFNRLVAGGCAGMTSVVITYPLDLWNTRMAVSRSVKEYKEVTLWKREGLISLTRGLLPTVLGIFPYSAISFYTFESLKHTMQKQRQRIRRPQPSDSDTSSSAPALTTPQKLPPWLNLLCGGTAGLVSQTATYPIDTVRKRLQADIFLNHIKELRAAERHHAKPHSSQPLPEPLPHATLGSIGRATAQGVWWVVSDIWRTQGIRGFYNGVTLNWIKGPLSVGLSFTLHELLRH
ncbi:unnamed protein product [Vitrella brassicaformis CCMP3155]|uniref:Mitochondrial carrier protein n=2 Tax=Vitrella brassicaformis TaxID=1169539 RepID=A0A0G4GL03_VITBC|nr:unnamed protein product [Vitrella brassicaformis CCMP3155]|mmetsp:Transcript_208/g.533  ORF Transcript_208/g.533 Transcript_208/m.533 type:complete len:396 (+) Transcript_208:200-1387(+)|eukprot:CEM30677.1 unnamed protein product [Vitrella brassicaformis CCMP3155]